MQSKASYFVFHEPKYDKSQFDSERFHHGIRESYEIVSRREREIC